MHHPCYDIICPSVFAVCKLERVHGGRKGGTDVVLTSHSKLFMSVEVRATEQFRHLRDRVNGGLLKARGNHRQSKREIKDICENR